MFELSQSPDAPHEIDSLVTAQVLDAEDFIEDEARGDGDVELADGVAIVVSTRFGGDAIGVSVEVEGEVVQLLRLLDLRSGRLYREVLLQPGQELIGCESVKILHNPVIVDNGELVVGEADRHEVVVFLIAPVVRVVFHFLGAHQCGGSGTVMAVGDVHGRHGGEKLCDTVDVILIRHQPEVVSHTIYRNKVIFRRSGGDPLHDGVYLAVFGVGEKDRLNVCIVHPHMFHPILLLVASCQFMLLDLPVHVILHGGSHHQAILPFAVHGLGIDVIKLFLILQEPSLVAEHTVVLRRFQVDILVVFILACREIDLRLDDVVKRLLVAFSLSAGLF